MARSYGLFHKVVVKGRGRWVRLFPRRSYAKTTAIRAFQGYLLKLSFAGKEPALRPV